MNNSRTLKGFRAAAGGKAIKQAWLEANGFVIVPGQEGAYVATEEYITKAKAEARAAEQKALAAAKAAKAYEQIFQDTNGGKSQAYPYLPEAEGAPSAAKIPKAVSSVREALMKKGGSMSIKEMRTVPACAKLLERAGCNAETSPSTADALLMSFFKAQERFFRANGDVVALKMI